MEWSIWWTIYCLCSILYTYILCTNYNQHIWCDESTSILWITPGGGQFHTLVNPQPRATPAGGNVYNPHHNIPNGMVPNQAFMNNFGGGSYNIGKGHGAYQNPRWVVIPQQQSFLGSWGHMPQPRLPFLATLNFLYLSTLMNDPMHHGLTWPPIPTKLHWNILIRRQYW
jgi:hypothetical protein